VIFHREWAMPSADTFDVPPIGEFVGRYLSGVSVDPFARNSRLATHRNDLNPDTSAEHHMDARAFLTLLRDKPLEADCVLFDPPYSPRQITECYTAAGLKAGMRDTQSARFKRECRELVRSIVRPGGVVLSFGWNTVGMGPEFDLLEILMVCHGGDHNDTLCIAERRRQEQLSMKGIR
jgi:hypothetical protein